MGGKRGETGDFNHRGHGGHGEKIRIEQEGTEEAESVVGWAADCCWAKGLIFFRR